MLGRQRFGQPQHQPDAQQRAIGPSIRKMCRHEPIASTAWPKVGASTGTIMKMIIVIDMMRAMPEPW
jgi:hypothetical protein